MAGTQSKIARHAQKSENIHNEEKSIKTNTDITKTTDLLDKNFRIVIVNAFSVDKVKGKIKQIKQTHRRY